MSFLEISSLISYSASPAFSPMIPSSLLEFNSRIIASSSLDNLGYPSGPMLAILIFLLEPIF
jgi:hypothetical protein